MKQVLRIVVAGFFLLLRPDAELAAQLWEAGAPGEDLGSLAIQFGAVSPSEFSDGASYSQGLGVGATLSLWPTRYLGLRTYATRGETEGDQGSAPFFSAAAAQSPIVWLYGLEAALRLPMGSDSFGWFPYVAGGIAGKSYRWSIDRPTIGDTRAGYSVAGGLELRPGGLPLGVITEVRMLQHKFDLLGYDEDYRDLVFTAGITLNR